MSNLSDTCKSRKGEFIREYHSLEEASEAANYANRNYGHNLAPYRCSRCNFWHLSPKDRITPSSKSNCLDRKGNKKQVYSTREAAERRAEIIEEEIGSKLEVYECKYCGGYHLAHKRK